MVHVRSAVLVCISLLMFSCSPSSSNQSLAASATEAYANTIKIAETMVAGTAEFESKLQLAIQQTATAMPTNTYTPIPTNTATSTPTFTPTATATYTPTMTANFTATNTSTPTITPSPTYTPSLVPTNTSIPSPTVAPTVTPGGYNRLSAGTVTNIHVRGHSPRFIEVAFDYEWTALIPDWWLGRGSQGNLDASVNISFRNLATGESERHSDTSVLPGAVRLGTLVKAISTDQVCKWEASGSYVTEVISVNISTRYSELGTPIPDYPWLNTLEDNFWITKESIDYSDWQFSCP